MPRRNGSYFGLTVNPTPSVASGIWRVREAEENLRVNKWPATPGVPGSPVGAGGDSQVSLTWSAPTLGTPPTDYQVQYSSNSGSSWATFSDGTSAATSAVVTGLTNGTGYIFRVRAVNALGEGPYGAAGGTVTPSLGVPCDLLLHFDGTNGSTTFTDSSGNGVAVTVNGNAAISTAQSKFGGSSGNISTGSGIITTPDFGFPNDFTIEGWFFFNANNTGYQPLVSAYGSSDATAWVMLLETNNALHFYGSPGYYWELVCPSAYVPTPGQWVHIAVTRAGETVKMFADGVEVGATYSSTNVAGGTTVGVGYYEYFPDFPRGFDGYIDELRIVKGTAIYTANFTPPTAPFANPPVAPRLLLHFDGANGSTTFTDSSPNGLAVTANGGAAISTAQSKFGGASGYFDGDGDSLSFSDLALGTNDFTIEAWIKTDSQTQYAQIIGNETSPDGFTLLINHASGGAGDLAVYVMGNFVLSGGSEINDDSWHHIALVKDSGTLRLFVDGAQVASATNSSSYTSGSDTFVANNNLYAGRDLACYIDELRIFRGTAIYTANFTPPTAPF